MGAHAATARESDAKTTQCWTNHRQVMHSLAIMYICNATVSSSSRTTRGHLTFNTIARQLSTSSKLLSLRQTLHMTRNTFSFVTPG